jgi:hypothetical protein
VAVLARPTDPADEEALRDSVRQVAPGVDVEFTDVVGPSVAASLRGSGWAEVAALVSSLDAGIDSVTAPAGGRASAEFRADGSLQLVVRAGTALDEVVLRSYCIGAAHMALGIVRREGVAVDDEGVPLDLTIRSFGILRSDEMPHVDVTIEGEEAEPVAASDAVFAAVLAAAWREAGFPGDLPARG